MIPNWCRLDNNNDFNIDGDLFAVGLSRQIMRYVYEIAKPSCQSFLEVLRDRTTMPAAVCEPETAVTGERWGLTKPKGPQVSQISTC